VSARRLAAVLAGCLLTGLLPMLAQPATAAGSSATAAAAASANGYHATKTLTRQRFLNGASTTADTRDVTVDVDKTTELRGRERIRVSWSGAHPSGGRAANPYGETGLAQEYPVVILQCRGTDDPTLPAAKQLSPSTCWTSTRQQRTQSASESAAVWRHDAYATDVERARVSGVASFPDDTSCTDVPILSTHITPFVSAKGTVFSACSPESMPPEAAAGASYPPSELAAFTDVDGTGSTQFEVRSDLENESLGCSHTVACSVVVIPIMGISCLDADPVCNKAGRFAPGSSNFVNDGVDDAVSPLYWWSPSNWRNRFSVPVTFGLPPDACDVLDTRSPTAFYGSELMSQASLQWAPAYCLRKDRFKFQHNRMADEAAFSLMETGQAPGAFVSGRRDTEGGDPVGYAPTAVTGFAVSYVIDKPDNAGELTDLRLTPRLLAKLLTQSYPASDLGRQHPGLETNPLSINQDPEFTALNPGLDDRSREAAATVLSLSQSSDVVRTLTEYIAADKDATAFVKGQPDPWGMKVNPAYKGLSLPLSEWPLKDTFVPTSSQECLQANPAVYLSQVAAPVSYLRTIAEAVLDAWPNTQTRCDRATSTDPWKLGRSDRQGIGGRFMLGITSLGDAARFGLRTAQLQTTEKHFAGPTDAALAAAVRHATQAAKLAPFTIAQAALKKDAAAYPATMVVYTAARTANLPTGDAAKVASFIRTATTEGQKPGPGNGQLPGGYLPIRSTGATEALFAAASQVADAVAAQKGAAADAATTDKPKPATTGAPRGTGSTAGSATTVGGVPASSPASATPPGTVSSRPVKAAAASTPQQVSGSIPTTAETSRVARALIPLLLFGGLLAGLGSALVRIINARGRR
jgi:hypothetical protein